MLLDQRMIRKQATAITFHKFYRNQFLSIFKEFREKKRNIGNEETKQETDNSYSKSPSSGNQVDGLPLVLHTELLLS